MILLLIIFAVLVAVWGYPRGGGDGRHGCFAMMMFIVVFWLSIIVAVYYHVKGH